GRVVHEARLRGGRGELHGEARAQLRTGWVVTRTGVRLRQAVVAARELDPVAARLRQELGLREPFDDPGVGACGRRNAVLAGGARAPRPPGPTRRARGDGAGPTGPARPGPARPAACSGSRSP